MENIIDDRNGKFDQDLAIRRKAKTNATRNGHGPSNEIHQTKSIERGSEFDQSMKRRQVLFINDEP